MATMQLAEPIVVPDVFVTSLAEIEDIGEGNWRFTFAVKQSGEHIVSARLVLPGSLVISAARQALRAVGWHCVCSMKRLIH